MGAGKIYEVGTRKKKSTSGKTRRSRRTKFSDSSSVIVRGPQAIKDQYVCKLVYCETLKRSPASAIDNYLFRGNSVYDPNQSGVGSQPYYFDSIAQLYQQYRVTGSKLEVELVNTAAVPAMATLFPANETISVTDIDDWAGNRYSKSRVMAPSSGSPNMARLSTYATTAAMYGVSANIVKSEKDYSAAVTTNPTNQWNWHIIVGSMDKATNITYEMRVKVTYYVKFEKPQLQELS